MVDADGFRPNVGIVLVSGSGGTKSGTKSGTNSSTKSGTNVSIDSGTELSGVGGSPHDEFTSNLMSDNHPHNAGRVLWARRVGGHDAWQFPQGGINDDESAQDALYRELYEEVGLQPKDVKILTRTKGWLRYRLPRKLRRHNSTPGFVGQKQKWFLLELVGDTRDIRFDCGHKPEFDGWRWVSYWYPITKVVDFKREVYRRALLELAPGVPGAKNPDLGSGPSSGQRAANRTNKNRRKKRRRPKHSNAANGNSNGSQNNPSGGLNG